MFKRIFGKPDDELPGLNVSRFVPSVPTGEIAVPADSSTLELPSRKPPPNLQDLVLPETLAEEATHPRDVDVRFVLATPGSPSPAGSTGPAELTDAQIEAIAQRVADKLAAGVLGDRLREAVSRIVSETSERLVREEIARVRAEIERD